MSAYAWLLSESKYPHKLDPSTQYIDQSALTKFEPQGNSLTRQSALEITNSNFCFMAPSNGDCLCILQVTSSQTLLAHYRCLANIQFNYNNYPSNLPLWCYLCYRLDSLETHVNKYSLVGLPMAPHASWTIVLLSFYTPAKYTESTIYYTVFFLGPITCNYE